MGNICRKNIQQNRDNEEIITSKTHPPASLKIDMKSYVKPKKYYIGEKYYYQDKNGYDNKSEYIFINFIEKEIEENLKNKNYISWKEKYESDPKYRKEVEGKYLVLRENNIPTILEHGSYFEFKDDVQTQIYKICENLKSTDTYKYWTNCDIQRFFVRIETSNMIYLLD